jgi:hypothetical protein
MKYTVAGEPELTNAMKDGIVAATLKETFLNLTPEQAAEKLSPAELKLLAGHSVMGVNCTYLGDPLSAVVLFRDGKQPFTADDANMLKSVAPLFAVALASIVRDGHPDGDPDSPENAGDSAPPDDPEDHPEPPRKKKRREDPADWWKRGESPPF